MSRNRLPIALSFTFALVLLASDAWAGPGADKKAQQTVIVLWTALPFVALLVSAGLGAFMTYRATFTRRSERVLRAAGSSPIKSFILGAANTALLLIVSAALGEGAPAIAALFMALLLLLAFMGLAAKAESIGARIAKAAGRECSAITAILIGWPTLVGILIIPFIGWGIVIYIAVCGVGAAILSFFAAAPDAEKA